MVFGGLFASEMKDLLPEQLIIGQLTHYRLHLSIIASLIKILVMVDVKTKRQMNISSVCRSK